MEAIHQPMKNLLRKWANATLWSDTSEMYQREHRPMKNLLRKWANATYYLSSKGNTFHPP